MERGRRIWMQVTKMITKNSMSNLSWIDSVLHGSRISADVQWILIYCTAFINYVSIQVKETIGNFM